MTSIAQISRQGGRDYNEDTCDYLTNDKFTVVALADGLGGHGGGDVASQLSVAACLSSIQSNPSFNGDTLKQAILHAQAKLLSEQKTDIKLERMRTTMVLCLIQNNQALWVHVGDSRLYHFSDLRLKFQTNDHSVPQVLANTGEIHPSEIRHHEDRNRLISSLGNEGRMKLAIEKEPHDLKNGDAILLCTDGFWEYVTEVEMVSDLAKSQTPEQWLNYMEMRLLDKAPTNNDNYTAMVVWI